jgi:hypothetical protein
MLVKGAGWRRLKDSTSDHQKRTMDDDGSVPENTVRFQHDSSDAWREAIPPEMMPKLQIVLTGLSRPEVMLRSKPPIVRLSGSATGFHLRLVLKAPACAIRRRNLQIETDAFEKAVTSDPYLAVRSVACSRHSLGKPPNSALGSVPKSSTLSRLAN